MTTTPRNELADDVDTPLSMSNRLLSQAEGVKVNFYTINFARLICRNIQTATQGQRVYNNCFANLPVFRSSDSRLQFGWADTYLLRNPGVQLHEYEPLLLASALGEFFSEDYAAAVFSFLGNYVEDEDRPKPHISSFRYFVQSTNGILSTSDFSIVVEDRIRLNPYHDQDHMLRRFGQSTELISPSKFAEAIYRLGQVQHGDAVMPTFVGGDELGWFSAFAEIFLGFDVTLQDQGGEELHRASVGQKAPLKLIFVPSGTSETAPDPTVVWLRDPNRGSLSTPVPPISTGRITWNSLFTKTFGKAFVRLDQAESRAFGNAMGGLARVWELIAMDASLPEEVISTEVRSNPGSKGMGLIQTWTDWFPELRHLQGRMERGLKEDLAGAGRICDESIKHFESLCGCFICSPTQGQEEHPTNLPVEDFCIPTLMETVIMLGLALSRVTVAPGLYPSRAGILAMYNSQVRKRLEVKRTNAAGFDRHKILFGSDWNSTYPKRLVNVVTMFSGSWPQHTDLPENLMAISHEGVCAYALKLQRGDYVPAGPDDQVIGVVSGSIQWKQKMLRRLGLGPVDPPVGIEAGWESATCQHLEQKIFFK